MLNNGQSMAMILSKLLGSKLSATYNGVADETNRLLSVGMLCMQHN